MLGSITKFGDGCASDLGQFNKLAKTFPYKYSGIV